MAILPVWSKLRYQSHEWPARRQPCCALFRIANHMPPTEDRHDQANEAESTIDGNEANSTRIHQGNRRSDFQDRALTHPDWRPAARWPR